ncbi:hypothetical protein BDW59DRAFT_145880 [Aspergillus cavernicola]|uniref:Uncharacterized protein n=1 Tax=Aspergillus cavernicola TaxID=176166 RepID=A0ABR4IFT1_9EURO
MEFNPRTDHGSRVIKGVQQSSLQNISTSNASKNEKREDNPHETDHDFQYNNSLYADQDREAPPRSSSITKGMARRIKESIPTFKISFHVHKDNIRAPFPSTRREKNRDRSKGSSIHESFSGKDATICQSDIPELFFERRENRESLFNTLVLTAGNGVVEAGSCGYLMRQKFGDVGLRLLQHIICALEREDSTSGCTQMTIRITANHISATNHGAGKDLLSALVWLCLAIRKPRIGQVSLSTTDMHYKGGSQKIRLRDLKPLAPPSHITSCWFPLFQSAVVAMEPSAEKLTPDSWLQVDFNTLIQLAAVEYPVTVGSGVVLLGYSTALIPVKMLDNDVILWHLEVCSHESQFKVSELEATKAVWLQSQDLEFLKSKTARVGWCRKSNVLMGTAALLQSPVGWSTGKPQNTTWKWKGASLQAVATSTGPLQLGFQGGATFERVTNTLRFEASRNYLRLLQSSSREAIILYDVNAKRAWLVPLLSVLHHMAITYCRAANGGKELLPVPLARPSADGGASSMKALRQSGSVQIETGGDDILTLRDLLMGFSANLAKISAHRPRHKKIFGYEFMDVVHEVPSAKLKRVPIQASGMPWTSLLECVPCLFCSNLGEAIVGVSTTDQNPECKMLATGNDYLAASIHCVNNISERQGQNCNDTATTRFFPGGWSWKPTRVAFCGCKHIDESDNCWVNPQFLQETLAKQSERTHDLAQQIIHKDGVVVFGKRKSSSTVLNFTGPTSATDTLLPQLVGSTNANSATQNPIKYLISILI